MHIKIKKALISVSDKTDIIPLIKILHHYGVEILSTGGTALAIKNADIPVTDVSDYTGFPEIMDGRVKTLHPKIHGGLLSCRDLETHKNAQKQHQIDDIDLLIVNLYPFEKTISQSDDPDKAIENIDIGGPAMIRSAAKNHHFVTVVTSIEDYSAVIKELDEHQGQTTLKLRQHLALKAFSRTAAYDAVISSWFSRQFSEDFPNNFSLSGQKKETLRYGENPHQKASFYITDRSVKSVANATQHQGKPLSYNNLNDTNAAFDLISALDQTRPACAVIKHANPCGVAYGNTLQEAYQNAFSCDTVSAFGGIIACNQIIDAHAADQMVKIFTEVIIAPDVSDAALEIFSKKKNLRILTTGGLTDFCDTRLDLRTITGGFLVQNVDYAFASAEDLEIVTQRAPTDYEIKDLLFSFTVAHYTKSNAIIFAKDGKTVGIGAGQMSRLDSSRIAFQKAKDMTAHNNLADILTKNSVVASDAFFPFADGLITAAEAGVTAVIQPGGSIRDQEVIDAANERDIAMVFTGKRHFKH